MTFITSSPYLCRLWYYSWVPLIHYSRNPVKLTFSSLVAKLFLVQPFFTFLFRYMVLKLRKCCMGIYQRHSMDQTCNRAFRFAIMRCWIWTDTNVSLYPPYPKDRGMLWFYVEAARRPPPATHNGINAITQKPRDGLFSNLVYTLVVIVSWPD